MLYFISDTHFNHKNIIKYCNRPFEDIEEMNDYIIKQWNKMVKIEDIVYHLGDLVLGNSIEAEKVLIQLNGIKYLIKGNHDHFRNSFYEKCGFKILKNAPIVLDEYKIILSHKPIPDTMIIKDYINVHGHIHTKTLEECFESYNPKFYKKASHINISCDITEFKVVSVKQLKK